MTDNRYLAQPVMEWLRERVDGSLAGKKFGEAVAEIERLTDSERYAWKNTREIEAERQGMLRAIQKHQPAGSPPPGDGEALANWVLQSQAQELERLRHAVRKVRAHTCYRPDASRELLEGLLASVLRIADGAEHGTSSPETSDSPWKRPADKFPERGAAVLLAWKRGPTWAYAVGKYTGKRWLEVEPDTVNEQFTPPDYWRPLDRPCIDPPTSPVCTPGS